MIQTAIVFIIVCAIGCYFVRHISIRRFKKKIVKLEQQVLEHGWRMLELEKEKREIEEMFTEFKRNHEDEMKHIDRK